MNGKGMLSSEAKSMEDAFFMMKESELIRKHREAVRREGDIDALGKASGIANREVLAKLHGLGITPETAMSLAVIPLVEIAWADGRIDDSERTAVLEGAAQCGISRGRLDFEMLEAWLADRPPASLLEAWSHFIAALCAEMERPEAEALKQDVLGRARKVAAASGGFLGLGSPISDSERRMLDVLEASFR